MSQLASESEYGSIRSLREATAYFLKRLQYNAFQFQPKRMPALDQRDAIILEIHSQDVHPNEIAARFVITPPRVYQIISQHKNR